MDKTSGHPNFQALLNLRIDLQKESCSLDWFLSELLIPKKDSSNIKLPFVVQELCKSITGKGEEYVPNLLARKTRLHGEIHDMLNEVSTVIINEESDNEAYRIIYKNKWILPHLQNANTQVWFKLCEYKHQIAEANINYQRFTDIYAVSQEDFAILFCPKELLLSKYINCLNQCRSCGTVRYILCSLDKVSEERKLLLEKLEEAAKGVVSGLIYQTDKAEEDTKDAEKITASIKTNIERQKEVMKCLQVEYAKFVEEKKQLNFTNNFISAFEKWSELSQKLEKTNELFESMKPQVSSFKEEVVALCNTRKSEKEHLVKLLQEQEKSREQEKSHEEPSKVPACVSSVPLAEKKRFRLEITNFHQLLPRIDKHWLDSKMKEYGSTEKVHAHPTLSYIFPNEAGAREAHTYLNGVNPFAGFLGIISEEYSTL